MFNQFGIHNRFKSSIDEFQRMDPHLHALSQLKYQYSPKWWSALSLSTPGVYILTGGRQVGKSTSCKLLIDTCLRNRDFSPNNILYLPCDEIYDAKTLSETIRFFLSNCQDGLFLLIIDEITFVKHWDRVIKSLADEGVFRQGLCLLTGSDTLILKEAAMRFPGRRGNASQTDFHLSPLSFSEYAQLRFSDALQRQENLPLLFQEYLLCGGYLRAINDLAEYGEVTQSTYSTYEQWIRGDFLRQGKHEETLIGILQALLTIGVSQISYSKLTQKIGLISKETCIDYCRLLERMGILIDLQAFDQNKKQGFPRKDRKFHFTDPFVQRTLVRWLVDRGVFNDATIVESHLVEACVASHCHRWGRVFYFKGQGEIDVILLQNQQIYAVEVKWSNQLRPHDLNMLKLFKHAVILTKTPALGIIEGIKSLPAYSFLYEKDKATEQGST